MDEKQAMRLFWATGLPEAYCYSKIFRRCREAGERKPQPKARKISPPRP